MLSKWKQDGHVSLVAMETADLFAAAKTLDGGSVTDPDQSWVRHGHTLKWVGLGGSY